MRRRISGCFKICSVHLVNSQSFQYQLKDILGIHPDTWVLISKGNKEYINLWNYYIPHSMRKTKIFLSFDIDSKNRVKLMPEKEITEYMTKHAEEFI